MESSIIMEIRGCMTRYDPLTPDLLKEMTSDSLTYEDLRSCLSRIGLSVEKIVCDPTRRLQNAFYADYENGRYCEIYLQRAYLDTLVATYSVLFRRSPKSESLRNRDWTKYYQWDVPVPMLIYDFQKRYREIEPSQVFEAWITAHTRIDYSNGLWRDDVLEYVFSHAPTPHLPTVDDDGMITIYRGMGNLSQPPEKAISWTTNPINALWFANRSGHGTKLLVAQIAPKQVVAYFPSFGKENEVIVRPGSVASYHVEDMIPVNEEIVPNLLLPAMGDFVLYTQVAKTLGYPTENAIQIHGLKHIFRVLLLSLIYYYNANDNLSEADKQILIYFSLLHDIGRINELVDEDHGDRGLQQIRRRGIRLRGIRLTKKDYRIADLLIANHCRDDEIGYSAIQAEPSFSMKDRERARHLYEIAKDMDGLDRVRFNGLDYRMLRTAYGRKLPLIAGCLLEEKAIDSLCTKDWDEVLPMD